MVAFCRVDDALARMALDDPGVPLVVEVELGAGVNAYRNYVAISACRRSLR